MHFVNTERSNKVVIYFESSSICVSPGYDGLTGDILAVRPAALGRSDRRRRQAAAGDLGHRPARALRHIGSTDNTPVSGPRRYACR